VTLPAITAPDPAALDGAFGAFEALLQAVAKAIARHKDRKENRSGVGTDFIGELLFGDRSSSSSFSLSFDRRLLAMIASSGELGSGRVFLRK
jgi:hypothetical protein